MGRLTRTGPTACAAIRAVLWLALGFAVPSRGDGAQTDPPSESGGSRIERLERLVSTVVEENRRLADEVRSLKEQLATQSPQPPSPSLPEAIAGEPLAAPEVTGEWAPIPPPTEPTWVALPASPSPASRFRVDYANGFAILPENLDETPFSLRVRSQNIFRYNGFARDATFWIDSAGNQQPIDNSNYFAIPRGRLIFSGNALLPRLHYLLNIDYNSVASNPIGFRAYELGYRFSRAFELFVGQSKVPGSREWLESASAPLQGPDRSMATTFFRPSLSQGVWITGRPRDELYYHAMVSNGFNTLNQLPNRLNNRFCYSASLWWEPWSEYGRGYSDVQDHEEAAIRLGGAYTYAIGRGSQSESDAVENSPLRLSDGTIITTTGALAPGVTVQTYDVSLAAIDLSYKYRGLGLSAELYSQELLRLSGSGPLPIESTRAFGGFVQGGYFLIPQSFELYAHTSLVTGAFGSGWDVGGGLNWYPLKGNENLRFTFDADWLADSPAGQNRTGFVAGQSGLLIRTQITIVY